MDQAIFGACFEQGVLPQNLGCSATSCFIVKILFRLVCNHDQKNVHLMLGVRVANPILHKHFLNSLLHVRIRVMWCMPLLQFRQCFIFNLNDVIFIS
jgi:hypothetical protein